MLNRRILLLSAGSLQEPANETTETAKTTAPLLSPLLSPTAENKNENKTLLHLSNTLEKIHIKEMKPKKKYITF
jgi:hypothetical protein